MGTFSSRQKSTCSSNPLLPLNTGGNPPQASRNAWPWFSKKRVQRVKHILGVAHHYNGLMLLKTANINTCIRIPVRVPGKWQQMRSKQPKRVLVRAPRFRPARLAPVVHTLPCSFTRKCDVLCPWGDIDQLVKFPQMIEVPRAQFVHNGGHPISPAFDPDVNDNIPIFQLIGLVKRRQIKVRWQLITGDCPKYEPIR
mmetsp:Transcript_5946/g.9257  ORF Transcript_5946/g.9257 Transcript_5946/m.9257 type:complete len:197 (-) Transcript_5946:504-1094(-)